MTGLPFSKTKLKELCRKNCTLIYAINIIKCDTTQGLWSKPKEIQNNWLPQAATSNLELELIKSSSLKQQ